MKKIPIYYLDEFKLLLSNKHISRLLKKIKLFTSLREMVIDGIT